MLSETQRYLTRLTMFHNKSGFKVKLGWKATKKLEHKHYYFTTQGSTLAISLCLLVQDVKDLEQVTNQCDCPYCKTFVLVHPEYKIQSTPESTPDNSNPSTPNKEL